MNNVSSGVRPPYRQIDRRNGGCIVIASSGAFFQVFYKQTASDNNLFPLHLCVLWTDLIY